MCPDSAVFDNALLKLMSIYLDDLHSGVNKNSCLSPKREVKDEKEDPHGPNRDPNTFGPSNSNRTCALPHSNLRQGAAFIEVYRTCFSV